MKPIQISKKGVVGVAIAVVVAGLIVACGGGGQDSATGREQAMGEGSGNAISWIPTAIAFSINPGGRQDIPVRITASTAIPSATITVARELQSVVSVNPTSISALQAGQTATVTLSVAPSAAVALRSLNGTVRIVVGTATIAKPLPVSLTLVTPQIINGINVSPEPPPELNNATLAGFDTNGNGVRDDVERYIALNFPESQKTRTALTQIAMPSQQVMLATTGGDRDLIFNHAKKVIAGIDCLHYVVGPEKARESRGAMAALLSNTIERSRAVAVSQRLLGGRVFNTPKNLKLACTFDPDVLPN